jgi:membrane protease YdiL (CAAX protease family)
LMVALVLQHGPKWLTPPNHPIVGDVLHSDWLGWLQILFVASVGAPFVEETMFRGVLYRHLREATAGRGRWRSVVVSALVAAFLFAALHPQGLLGILPLMALACGFTAAREWRGSLVPSMTVHALHNGMLTVMLILAAG